MKHICITIGMLCALIFTAHAGSRAIQYRAWLINHKHDPAIAEFAGRYNKGDISDKPTKWPEGVDVPKENELPTIADSEAIIADASVTENAAWEKMTERDKVVLYMVNQSLNEIRREVGLPEKKWAEVRQALKSIIAAVRQGAKPE